MGQGDSARDFDTSESMKNAGILDVFPIFHTARLGQKIRRSPQPPLCGVAIDTFYYTKLIHFFKYLFKLEILLFLCYNKTASSGKETTFSLPPLFSSSSS